MKRIDSIGRLFWVALILLAVGVLLQGWRSGRVVAFVLGSPGQAATATSPVSESQDPLLVRLDEKDSLLAEAKPGERDPFRDPQSRRRSRPTPSRPQPRRQAPTPPVEETPPTMRTLLFDRVNPGVQLRSGEENSGWLHVGDSYKGWRVAEIAENSVTITKGSRSVVLSAF